jgi:hypothetical protein
MPNAVVATMMEKAAADELVTVLEPFEGGVNGFDEVHVAWIRERSAAGSPAWYATAFMLCGEDERADASWLHTERSGTYMIPDIGGRGGAGADSPLALPL